MYIMAKLYLCGHKVEHIIFTTMYKPRPIPALKGAAAERLHRMMTDGSFHEEKDYSRAHASFNKIMQRSAEYWQ